MIDIALSAIDDNRLAPWAAIETWSSWLAEVGIESTLAGWASVLFSATSAAAVTCAIMNPELSPVFGVRNAGRPDKVGSISNAILAFSEGADFANRERDYIRGESNRLGVKIAA